MCVPGFANVIVWFPGRITKLCGTVVAAAQLVFPAWSALIVQVAVAPLRNVTEVPETVQTLVVEELNVTGLPEPPPVALTVNGL